MEIERNAEEVVIRNTAELSLEELERLKENGLKLVKVRDERGNGEPSIYDYDTFKEIKEKIGEYTKNTPKVSEDDPDKEKKIFTYIYLKIAKNISYDEFAAGSSTPGYVKDWIDLHGAERIASYALSIASDLRGILDGKAVAVGYSEILRNILSEVGIDALCISDAWNQVNLDGKWYNCNILTDANFILKGLKLRSFLKSNEEFAGYKNYPCKDPSKIQEASESISEEKQEELIEEQRENLLEEEKLLAGKRSIGRGFIAKLKNFFKDKKIGAKELHDFTVGSVSRDERGSE